MILPGATLGVVGGGQLGRMFAITAQRMGYRVVVLDPDPDSPAGRLADVHLAADYVDRQALDKLARLCAAVTVEFENVPAESLERLARTRPVRPGAAAVAIAQDRVREKRFLAECGLAGVPFAVVHDRGELSGALTRLGGSAVLKRARLGYDGKGQARVHRFADALAAFESFGGQPCVLEKLCVLQTEISVVLARGADGATVIYPAIENRHRHGILEASLIPARAPRAVTRVAVDAAVRISSALDYVGVLAVEFFVSNGKLLVNEIAPRPHNSGHVTLDACVTSQFEQQVRALCGLPLGDPALLCPAAMTNLLGDLWTRGAPRWEAILREPRAKLHLYGKRTARPGRKMGHYTCLGDTLDEARARALSIRQSLVRKPKAPRRPRSGQRAAARG
ncbi:MAG: 5-(carboxyamino)imidazole ribonucleotide synthase [Gammaproteobacteria bacterium]|nr:5-(carboxyamino)imidazole ribonucleotide synthase [Gammaproteobacteria bacterium]